jgi:hypothetical protein
LFFFFSFLFLPFVSLLVVFRGTIPVVREGIDKETGDHWALKYLSVRERKEEIAQMGTKKRNSPFFLFLSLFPD